MLWLIIKFYEVCIYFIYKYQSHCFAILKNPFNIFCLLLIVCLQSADTEHVLVRVYEKSVRHKAYFISLLR